MVFAGSTPLVVVSVEFGRVISILRRFTAEEAREPTDTVFAVVIKLDAAVEAITVVGVPPQAPNAVQAVEHSVIAI